MKVVTTETVVGFTIKEHLGTVVGNTIRARHIGKDVMAGLRAVAGGEIKEYTKMLAESREQALQRMIAQAEALGANGIVNVRFQTSMILSTTAELLAYGTAVILEPIT